MSAPPTKRNDWLSPQNMIALLVMGLTVWASVQAFQRDTEGRMVRAESRIERLEADNAKAEARVTALERAQNEAALRVDRLEHQPN